MIDQKLLISELPWAPFLSGGLAGVLLSVNSAENGKKIIRTPFKDELIKKFQNITILKQYYDFPKNIDNLGAWYKKNKRVPYIDANEVLFEEVKSCCTREKKLRPAT